MPVAAGAADEAVHRGFGLGAAGLATYLDRRVDEFEAAIRYVCEPIFAKPIKDISFGRLLLQLFQTARRFNMEVQPQLVLLQKTLFNIEGLGRRLYPDLDLWVTAKPFLERWMRERLGPAALLHTLRRELPKWWQRLPEMPALAHEALRRLTGGELELEWKSRDLRRLREEIRQNQRRLYFAVAGGGMLIAAPLIGAVGLFTAELWGLIPWAGGLTAVAGAVLLWRARPGGGA